jgi:hypothetical protein
VGGLHDQIAGNVSAFALDQGTATTNLATPEQVGLICANRGKRADAVTLAAESNTWKVQTIDKALLDPSTAPLQVGTAFCTASMAGNYVAATALLSTALAAQVAAVGALQEEFVLPTEYIYAGLTPELNAYQAKGTEASYGVLIKTKASSAAMVSTKLSPFFVNGDDEKWQVDGIHAGDGSTSIRRLCEMEIQQALDASHRALYNVAVDRSVPFTRKRPYDQRCAHCYE